MHSRLSQAWHYSTIIAIVVAFLAVWHVWTPYQASFSYSQFPNKLANLLQMSMRSKPRASSSPHFRTIQTFKTEYSPTTLTHYESKKTGMIIVVVDREGPKVDGSFVLATEIHDDSGAPHTLEHLCFMGSKSYPYKGVLDKLAARAYSDTNAMTSTDNTQYTLDTAGWDGFAQILPIYLEHVLLPTLTDAGCYTEIHHVDGNGNDAGVVYSEMQADENSKEMLMWQKSKRMLYPEGVGFRYETFGMMNSLRALSADRIRDYHHEVYLPKNLCLVITGEVDHGNLLDILENFEATILEYIPKPDVHFKRPWIESNPAPPLSSSSVEVVEFPEEDESSGEILINFFGPSFADNILCLAMNVLLRYLAGNQASVLENTLVEKEQVCSGVYYECESRPTTVIQITLTSVDTEKLEQVEARFFDLLTEIAQSPIDLEYMRDCIQLEKRQVKFEAEGSGQAFVNPIIKDFLFGNRDGSTLRADLQNLNVYDTLEAWDDQQWRHWLKQWMAEAHHITVIGKPSSILPGKIESQEKARIATRKEKLGERGLKELEERLAAAKIENEKEIPKEVVSQLQTPNTTSIHFINTTSARSGAARKLGPLQNPVQRVIDQDDDLPLFIHFEHIQSNFVYLTIVLCTEAIPIPLRPLLGIYMNNFFSTPLMRDGKKLDFARVIMDLERDTVGYSAESGQNIGNPEVITIKLQAEVERYQTVIQWLRDLMFSSIFDVERLLSTTTKLLADIPDQKRDGSEMKNAVELMVDTSPSSITRACSTLVAGVYLKSVKHLLKKDPDVIVRQLKEINATLFQPSNFRILVVADIERLTNPVTSWDALIKGLENSGTLQPIDTPISRLSDQGRNPGNTAYVVPITSVDSSYAVAVAKGPSSYSDPAIPALMVAISYLNAIEGPIYKAIRGTGLAYGVAFRHYISSGQVSLSTSQSANLLGAFTASKEVVQSFVSGERALDPFDLEGAVSSIVLNFANTESTMANAAEMSFIRQVMRGLPKDWPTVILERVRKVEPEEIRNVMRDFVLPIFDSKTANLFVTCAPIMESTLVMGFRGIGFPTESKPLAFFQDDYGLKEEEGADEDEEDEDEDDEDDDEDEEEGEVDGVAEDRKDGNV